MVDRDVIGQARPPQAVADLATALAKGLAEERRRVLDRRERPEGVDHSDPEPAGEEWSVAARPVTVLGQVAPQSGDVVPAVVVDHEQPALGAENAIGLGDLGRIRAAERRPDADDGVGRGIRGRPGRTGRLDRPRPCAHRPVPGELVFATTQQVTLPDVANGVVADDLDHDGLLDLFVPATGAGGTLLHGASQIVGARKMCGDP